MGMMKCCPMRVMQDLDFSEGRDISLKGGYWLKDDTDKGEKNSCLWIQTAQGNLAKLG